MHPKATLLAKHFKLITREDAALESLSDESAVAERIRRANLPDVTDEEIEHAHSAVTKLGLGEELDEAEAYALEAIILPAERPVVDVVNDSFGDVEEPFAHLGQGEIRKHIEAAIPRVGRIGVPDRPQMPYGGTGFVVGKGLLMTNRHVAALFAQGVGREGLSFQSGQSADVDFKQEIGSGAPRPFAIKRIVMVHPYWDMALLEVEGIDIDPFTFLLEDPAALEGRDVAVIGYPAFDQRNEAKLQMRLFRKVFNVKRLQPGRLRDRGEINSFGRDVPAVTHDSSTLGGNSGSVVLDVESGRVVGLHFAGVYLKANFAVPMFELARDRRVLDAGVDFEGAAPETTTPWESLWQWADPPKGEDATAGSAPASPRAPATRTVTEDGDRSVTLTLPLEITVRLGRGAANTAAVGASVRTGEGEAIEAMVEPFHEDDYSNRTGYDEEFLGKKIPMPHLRRKSVASKLDDGSHEIPYEHFSIVVHKARRMALLTACNVDGRESARKPDPARKYTRAALSGLGEHDQEKWFTDPRIPAMHQLPDKFFNKDRKAFDKGHLVRRDAVAWGRDFDEVRRANGDSYHVTNCSPQVKGFNRSTLRGEWGQLENLVLKQAERSEERYSVFSGPILSEDDRTFSGFDDDGRISVRIPRRYWKIIVAKKGRKLASFAFLLDQDLSDVAFEFAVDARWRSRMISIPDLEDEIGLLRFPSAFRSADQFEADPGESVRAAANLERFEKRG